MLQDPPGQGMTQQGRCPPFASLPLPRLRLRPTSLPLEHAPGPVERRHDTFRALSVGYLVRGLDPEPTP